MSSCKRLHLCKSDDRRHSGMTAAEEASLLGEYLGEAVSCVMGGCGVRVCGGVRTEELATLLGEGEETFT